MQFKVSAKKIHCTLCNSKFTQRCVLLRHEHTIHGDESHKCEICNKSFNRKDILIKHSKTHDKQRLEGYDIKTNNLIKTSESNKWSSLTPSECNWCGQKKKLLKDKNYCFECSKIKIGRECEECNCLMHKNHFSSDVPVCDLCDLDVEFY